MSSITKRDKLGGSSNNNEEEMNELRRGPWTLEEDSLLIHYIARHGEGRWNMLAKSAGLKRNGKSCRLRWLNYLKPDIKRGNLTPQEQLLILELHSRWGNRWSKIAQHLPGRTDNEIKNYWRTRVQKQARQLNIESGSKKFIDAVRCFWMPRLFQKVEQKHNNNNEEFNNINEFIHSHPPSTTTTDTNVVNLHHHVSSSSQISQPDHNDLNPLVLPNSSGFISSQPANQYSSINPANFRSNFLEANSELIPSYYNNLCDNSNNNIPVQESWCVNYNSNGNTTNNGMELGVMNNYLQELEPMSSSSGIMEAYHDHQYQNLEFDYYYQTAESDWVLGNNMGDSLWNMDSV